MGISLNVKHIQLSIIISYKAGWQSRRNMGFGVRQNLALNPSSGNSPGGPVAKTSIFCCRGRGLETKIPRECSEASLPTPACDEEKGSLYGKGPSARRMGVAPA